MANYPANYNNGNTKVSDKKGFDASSSALQLKQFMESNVVQNKLKSLVGKNSAVFTTAVMQIANGSPSLLKCDHKSLLSAACMAATLNLPINPNLGFAYIVPYKNTAQFQLGYRGFIQLALRSGQIQRLVSVPVYKQNLVSYNPISGNEYDWTCQVNPNEQPIGYLAYIRLNSGFEAEVYMTAEEVRNHASRYSMSYKNDSKGDSLWATNFKAMALKTVLKKLLSLYAPISIDEAGANLATALEADQAVINDDNTFDYVDNPQEKVTEESLIPQTEVSDSFFKTIVANIEAGEVTAEEMLVNPNYIFSEEQKDILNNYKSAL